MRLDDPRLAGPGRRDPRAVGGRLVRRGVGRSPAVHRRRPARGRRDPARPPQALPADLRPVRRAPLLRGRGHAAGGAVAPRASGSGSASARTSGTSRVPAAPRARRGADPDQRVVVAGPGPGGHERGRARDRDVVADADADLRAADDVVRHLLQPGRRRRVDLVLGRLRGHRAERDAGLQRPALRRGAVHGRRSPPATSAASGSPCRCCATSGRSCTSASCRRIVAERAGMSPTRPRSRTPSPGSTWPPTPRPRPDRVRVRGRAGAPSDRHGPVSGTGRPARRRPHRVRFELPDELAIDTDVARRVISEFIRGQLAPGRLRAGRARAVGRHRLGARRVPRRRGHRRRAAARACCMPYRTSSPASRADAEAVVADLGLRRELVDISADGRRLLRGGRPGTAEARDSCAAGNFMARGCGWPCCTTAR